MFKSYVKIFSDEKNPRFLLIWHEKLDKYTYAGSEPEFSKELLTKKEAGRHEYHFGQVALDVVEKLGYEGGLLREYKSVIDEMKDKENVGIDQFAVLEFFRPDRPISGKMLDEMATKYRSAHPTAPPPLILTQAEIKRRTDVYHGIVKDLRKGASKKS